MACSASGSPARASATTSTPEPAGQAGRPQPRGERRAAGDGLEAARVAAAADDVVVAGHADVPDVAGGALRAPVHAAVGDDPAADPRADHHVQQVVDVPPIGPVLAQRGQVDVVVDERRDVVVRREPARDREAVPAGQHARRDRLHRRRRRPAPARRCRCPRPGSSARRRRAAARRSAPPAARARPPAAAPGPARSISSASGVPSRSLTAARHRLPSISATSTTPAEELNANVAGGRPPVDSTPVTSSSNSSASSVCTRSASVRARKAGQACEFGSGVRLAVADEPKDLTRADGAGVQRLEHAYELTRLRAVNRRKYKVESGFSRWTRQNPSHFCLTIGLSTR